MPFLPPNQQRQSTEGTASTSHNTRKINYHDEIAVTINKTAPLSNLPKNTRQNIAESSDTLRGFI